ncbi:MAG: divalent-cation tolerance protein CutA [Alphaproteobacteria bacterium]|nr:divalent-cation tolerance protein CutA [Alphaproteobacteria bacterium]
MKKFILIETTYPNLRAAKNLAKILLSKKLAACVQLRKIESLYFWEGEVRDGEEILLSIKTKKSLYKKVEEVIKKHHSYEIPQIFSIQIDQGFAPYLSWVEKSTKITGK